jgi:hypothetical protein
MQYVKSQTRRPSVGLYDEDYRLVGVVSQTAIRAQKSDLPYHKHQRLFKYVYPSQLPLLSYSEAVDFDNKMYYAK